MAAIDLNSDLGESYGAWSMGDDAAMLAVVSSANIACGFHAGDPSGIWKTVKAAAENGVSIGAHVSYPDRVGFGRRDMDVTSEELIADVIYQIGALKGMAAAANTRVTYVKPHGALYNRIANDARQGQAVIDAVKAIDASLVLMGLAGAPILDLARTSGLNTVAEAFADRAYTPQGQLVSRREAGAVLHDAEKIASRMVQLARQGTLEAIDGSVIKVEAQSICVHGDSPGAVAIAQEIRRRFEAEGIAVQPFVTA
ncbi:5-oxoprolinase subunit PxpA [Agrobacterium vitis]|uniref:LamB/YcsF family protein n=1 Tax=Rhizobium/Agrobacterium group TaxID=227290 RepID=UPI0008DC25FD|nr:MULTISPECIES: 5-oxoprolinase subunit PxpA [Rhizobium/Agrobacterium group]MCF1433119.1 LamB/YcsF family protein [Allorhizobium ampelinum]MUO91428.1 5-oxoprolinase subunit PxpA [Agrobacterium vitis]MUZ54882.1 5-oxoprolinase subunit PxpA [Agrobacterium vitis]MUZ93824.1 5-oxoprolinase subunit PxpA [Agrobacterium vitis]MVA41118.1 5-oxoprolinase subunit PxpA [Agrobacterium vitis]